MLFEKILELLAALAVAAASAAGLGTAADHADPTVNDAALTHKAAAVLSRAADVLVELEGAGPGDGLAQAVEAINDAMDSAPEAADDGLGTALDAVTDSPANDAPAGPGDLPVDVPAGPPTDLPGGRP